jgi:hypothetical protein
MGAFRTITLSLVLALSAWAQPPNSRLPRFEDYPVIELFTGTPAAPVIETRGAKKYQTSIRRGVEQGANFAGHYIVIRLGCGSGCVLLPIVDARTGVIHRPPMTDPFEFVMPMVGPLSSEVEFRPDSRLWTMTACPEQQSRWDGPCFRFYFLWQDEKWTQLRKVQLRDDER